MKGLANVAAIVLLGYVIYCIAAIAAWVWIAAIIVVILKLVVTFVTWAMIVLGVGVALWFIGGCICALIADDRTLGPQSKFLCQWVKRHPAVSTAATIALVSIALVGVSLRPKHENEPPPPVRLANMQLRNDGFWTRAMIDLRLRFSEPAVLELGDRAFVSVGGHRFEAKNGKWVEK
jgi:hypothetical protein